MFDLSTYQILLIIIGAIALISQLVYNYTMWIEFYRGAQSNLNQIYKIYSYLKVNRVKCRIKNMSQSFSRMQTSQTATVIIEIKKSEIDKANRLLSELHIKC